MDIWWKSFFVFLILSISSVSGEVEKCLVCDSATNNKCATSPQEITTTCVGTECFSLVDYDGRITRGCINATITCPGDNFTTTEATFNSTTPDPSSQETSISSQTETWQPDGGYTKKVEVKRPNCTYSNGTTYLCSLDMIYFSCYKCRSSENENCTKTLTDAAEYAPETCRNPVTNATKGCYTERWKNIVIRSCLVDADHETRQNCLNNDYKDCVSCTGEDCNKLAPPNSTRIMPASSMGIHLFNHGILLRLLYAFICVTFVHFLLNKR